MSPGIIVGSIASARIVNPARPTSFVMSWEKALVSVLDGGAASHITELRIAIPKIVNTMLLRFTASFPLVSAAIALMSPPGNLTYVRADAP